LSSGQTLATGPPQAGRPGCGTTFFSTKEGYIMKAKERILVLAGFLLLLAGAVNPVLADVWEYIGGYNGIPEAAVWVIEFAPNGRSFIGTDKGGARLVSGQWVDGKLVNYQWVKFLNDPPIPIYSIVFSPQGEVICASDSLYISVDNGKNWQTIKNTPDFQNIKDLEYVQGDLWVGDQNKVYSYSSTAGWNVELDQAGQKSFAKSSQGIYVGVFGQGIFYQEYGEGEWVQFNLNDYYEWALNGVKDIIFFKGKVWLVSIPTDPASGGVFVYDNDQ